jgi:hypothetical protein
LALKTNTNTQKDRIQGWGVSPIFGLHINLSDTYVFSIDAAYNIGREKGVSEVNKTTETYKVTSDLSRKSWLPICGLGMGVRF